MKLSNLLPSSLVLALALGVSACGGTDPGHIDESEASAAKARRLPSVPTGVDAAPRSEASEVTIITPPGSDSITCWCETSETTGCILELANCAGGCRCGEIDGTLQVF